MKQLLRSFGGSCLLPLLEPWTAVRARRFNFAAWLIGMPVLGLAGFWLPLALAKGLGIPIKPIFEQQLYGGALVAFSVAILTEGFGELLTAADVGSNQNARGIRWLAGVMAFGLIFLLVGVMVCEAITTSGTHVNIWMHISLPLLALLTAAYLYCFRFPAWEKSVDDAKRKEDKEVLELGEEAAQQKSAGGVEL